MLEWFDEHWYQIELDGGEVRFLASVTTKLQATPKPFLARWRGDVGNREADLRLYEAGARGTRIHYAASVLAKNGTVVYNPFNRPTYSHDQIKHIEDETGEEVFVLQDQNEMYQVVKFKDWLDEVKPEIVAYDKIVYDLENNDAGTIDFIFKINEGFYDVSGATPLALAEGYYIVDLKSSNQLQDDYWMQVAAYTKMAADNFINKDEIQGGLLIHTNAVRTKKGIPGLMTKLHTKEALRGDYEAYRHVSAIWERHNKNAAPKLLQFPSYVTLRSDDACKNNQNS